MPALMRLCRIVLFAFFLDLSFGKKALSGVKIQRDNAVVELGATGKVSLQRPKPRNLHVDADVTTFAGDIQFSKSGNLSINAASWKFVQDRLANITNVLRDNLMDVTGKTVYNDCKDILKAKPLSKSGIYTIIYKKKPLKVMCDMKTAGGGWTLIFRDSWKDKTVYAHGSGKDLPPENSKGTPDGKGDYVGPYDLNTIPGTSPLKSNGQLLYKIDSCTSDDCAMISDQEISFHAKKETDVDGGFHSSPITTLNGKIVQADGSTSHRLNYFYLYPSASCGIKVTDSQKKGFTV